MPGEVKDPTRGKCVTSHGLDSSRLGEEYKCHKVQKSKKLHMMMIKTNLW